MKPRRVVMTIELVTDRTLVELKSDAMISLTIGGNAGVSHSHIEQVQANVIRMRKPEKPSRAASRARRATKRKRK